MPASMSPRHLADAYYGPAAPSPARSADRDHAAMSPGRRTYQEIIESRRDSYSVDSLIPPQAEPTTPHAVPSETSPIRRTATSAAPRSASPPRPAPAATGSAHAPVACSAGPD